LLLEVYVSESEKSETVLPPFYKSAVPLNVEIHSEWRLLSGDVRFSSEAPASPITLSEFAEASRFYPILFTAEVVSPVALIGLEKRNLFVSNDRWRDDAYIPAYVRRYPFVLIETPDKKHLILAVDPASERLAKGGEEGAALFEKNQATDLTKQALEFCRLFNDDHRRTRAFCDALSEADLLVERQATVSLPNGRTLGIETFKVVDPMRFAKVDGAKLLEWHRNGWLAAVNFHLASVARLGDLLKLQIAQADPTIAAKPDSATAH
jgi:hypothetical protein